VRQSASRRETVVNDVMPGILLGFQP